MPNTILQPDNTNPFPPVAESSILNAGNYFSENLIDYPHDLGHGYIKNIKLHQGFLLTIRDYQSHEYVTEIFPENPEHPLQFYFQIAGDCVSNFEYASQKAGETALCGCGMSPRMSYTSSSQKKQEIDIHIQPELFKTLFGINNDVIPPLLKHLFRQPDEEYSVRTGTITTQMQVSLQQIWQCPFQGLVKQIYLESKVLELIALRLQQDITGEAIQSHPHKPKRTVIERIYQAKELLESRMENPPSMMEIA
ncbi:AraC family transcriptional regulator [Chlorogloeopsis sp. ULAP01]|uniref:AraC family transcriptional regulator n=1 Tax=Chlorogloeopsis sp. ULAP01 TaxID=3056483 RepID=UPI0025AABE3A|nr:AraC family transcriptional regulator [Chlorogloeopsis sp. ULAP01]MDM9379096.1 AraC family transcriptional regulator [Chlorogloeopsis sp. ULAP01]